MFIRVGNKIINTNQIVGANITPAREERVATEDDADWSVEPGEIIPGRPLSVDIITTTSTSTYDDGGDYPEFKHTDYDPYVIRLVGDDAKDFLDILPIYGLSLTGGI